MYRILLLVALLLSGIAPAAAQTVRVAQGTLEGRTLASGVHVFRGIPYAAPPVRDLRWRAPLPPQPWRGTRLADRFGPQCMQARVFGDMMFRSEGMSEDCLYLNVWTPGASSGAKLPVLVYFYGGGYVAGDGSEPRYDGEAMARRGIVAVTLNYRLGVFGFLAHPELSAEAGGASGNYGLLDQAQALRWVAENIAAFGGDPARVTIAGESAGSVSVSAQMASPAAKGLFAGAIGESGSILGTLRTTPLADAEAAGRAFGEAVGAPTLAALRALPATQLLELASRPGAGRFSPTIDGAFLPKAPAEVFAAGEQARVPLLLGWNSEESNGRALLADRPATPEAFREALLPVFGDRTDEALRLYPGATPGEVLQAATDLAGDRFIGFSTWKWFELHRRTSGAPVYRYFYVHPRPPMTAAMAGAVPGLAGGVTRSAAGAAPPPPPTGAVHSAEIEYALGNLPLNPVFAWTDTDYRVSEILQGYFANFIRTGNPNGPGLAAWPVAPTGPDDEGARMVIGPDTRAEPSPHRARYRFLDSLIPH